MATRILHILLAVLVFFSSTGLILVHHYCNKELKNIGVFVDFESCADSQNSESCCQIKSPKNCCKLSKNADNPDCCDTKIVYLKSDFVTVALLEEKADFEDFDFLKSNDDLLCYYQLDFTSNYKNDTKFLRNLVLRHCKPSQQEDFVFNHIVRLKS